MFKKYNDIISGCFLLLISISLFLGSFTIKRLTVSRIGAQFVPQLVAILLAILSIVIISGGLRKLKQAPQEGGSESEDKGPAEKLNYNSVIATFVLILIYVSLLNSIGFLIMTAVYLFGQFIVLAGKGERKLPMFAVIAICASTAIYFLFVNVFDLMLPAGILG